MTKAFSLTFLFWTLFTITNSVTDAILFYQNFAWYGDKWLWHFLKYWWIGFAVLTGWFAVRLWDEIWYQKVLIWKVDGHKPKPYKLRTAGILGFLLLWFLFLRWILFETLMKKWSEM
ncbi:hypothetical protein LCGC14_0351510 [marine sediment metagenome]|uniref:Uncharacterized protein n=1 Tax=marine sediment metagenome TaxID=412755 RepID=A0A0F9TTN8_9ZZZZ